MHPQEAPTAPPAFNPPAVIARALELTPNLPAKIVLTLASRLRADGELASAEAALDRISAGGQQIAVLEERARVAFASGDHARALELLQDRAERSPSATAHIAIARVHLEMGDVAAAKAISDALMIERPDLISVGELAASVALARGETEVARGLYLAQVDERPDRPAPLLHLARIALDEGSQDAAAEFLRRALAVSERPSAPNLRTAARLARQLGNEAQAARLESEAADIDSQREADFIAQLAAEIARFEGDPENDEPAPPIALRRQSTPPPSPPARTASADPLLRFDPTPTTPPPFEAPTNVLDALRTYFGYSALRPGQDEVIARVLAGEDTLAVMPTGAGKSLTFQLPAMLLPGSTLVISPLIALMKDQVDSLPAAIRAKTALVNSTLSADEMRATLDRLRAGSLKLIYVAPERLRHRAFLRALREVQLSLIVVDEAHCISMWGHDFRPDYLSIPRALAEMGQPPLLAITATATPAMGRQIEEGLGRELGLVRTSVFRPNLFYEVIECARREEKLQRVLEICQREKGVGIVYVSSRADAESIAGMLRTNRIDAVPYHAGMEPELRSGNQSLFMEGRARVIVATVAFGMGVNKSDVRFIVHVNPPASLEAYAQESGRAGRDGQPSRCVMLIAGTDERRLNTLIKRDALSLTSLRRLYAALRKEAVGAWAIIDPGTLILSEDEEDGVDARIGINVLEQAGLLHRHEDAARVLTIRLDRPPDDLEPAIDPALRDDWARLRGWLGERVMARSDIQFDTAAYCSDTGQTPADLLRLLGDLPGVSLREGVRQMCLELLPTGTQAAIAIERVLTSVRRDAERRIQQVIAYADGNRCRHLALAEHLGEEIDPCRVSCDICAHPAKRADKSGTTTPERSWWTAEDAWAAIQAVRTLPFPMGKTGLVRLLSGSVESRVRQDRSPWFGALSELKVGRIEKLIDLLIDDGLLYRDIDHEFKLITLTPMGAAATLESMASFAQTPVAARKAPSSSVKTAKSVEDDLAPAEQALFETLRSWRRRQAAEEQVPPYVVAHDSMLRNLVLFRPQSVDALKNIPGWGESRAARYGETLLGLIAEAR